MDIQMLGTTKTIKYMIGKHYLWRNNLSYGKEC